MKLALTAVEEAEYFRAEKEDIKDAVEDIKDAVEESDMADVVEVDLAMATKEEETIGAVDKMLKWCNTMPDHNWRFTRNMTSITMNGTDYLRKK